jgi:hypothetical protein
MEVVKMRKSLLTVLALAFLSGYAFASDGSNGEINVLAGVNVAGTISFEGSDDDLKPDAGFAIGAEYLYPVVADIVKVGIGVQYLFPTKADSDAESKISYVPIYATVQVNPISVAKEVFFKANIGYAVISVSDLDDGVDAKDGFICGLGAGYEFPFGLILSADYSFYYASLSEEGHEDSDFNYSKLGLNAGYKFKL